MKEVTDNPSTNKLPPGLTYEDIDAAVSKSGYPLQTVITNLLRPDFFVEEEWSYLDEDTNELRAMDIVARKLLWDIYENQPRVRPELNLLVECKKSELPYVFFLSQSKPLTGDYPLIAGLFNSELCLTTDDDLSTWRLPIIEVLDLLSHSFITEEPICCNTFTKCVRQGSSVELTGADLYLGTVLPLIKAMRYFERKEKPPKTAYYFDCHLIIGIGVLDAPMVGAHMGNESHDLVLLPWVRLFRHRTEEHQDSHKSRDRIYAIDIVHKDFFQDYINKHLLPFTNEFSKLIIKHQEVLADGRGFIRGMHENSWTQLEQRLEPIVMRKKLARSKVLLSNIGRIATFRKPVDW